MSDKTANDKAHDAETEDQLAEEAQQDQAEADAAAESEESPEDKLAAAEARAEENWNQYLRAVAELENSRKRAERDVAHAHKFALEKFAGELLAVKDSLEMGLSAAKDSSDTADALFEGTEMTLKQFEQVLEKFGIEEIAAEGEEFNPEVHEAMAMQPSEEVRPDHVLTVVQKGYTLNGRVLRPARVLVAKAPEAE